MLTNDFHWLPERPDWLPALQAIDRPDAASWDSLRALANSRIDFLRTNRLDRVLLRLFGSEPPAAGIATKPVRLAVLGGSTVDHLLPGLRVGALRRGLHLTTHVGDYGQYVQELNDPDSALYAFRPTAILLSLDAASLLGAPNAAADTAAARGAIDAAIERLRALWRLALDACQGQVIQQTVLPLASPLLGSNEHRLAGSQRALIDALNYRMREAADAEGVDILALDSSISDDGLFAWHDPMLWHRAKQEISPKAAPGYGDLVARLLAAQQGRSAKCLVLDLDNTLWGGVIGDDGLEGIVLGQGSALGEAFVAFQHYAKELSRRGIILAVCSKNDEANALAPFEKHPDMVLRRQDIACFVANWQDKPSNLRTIAKTLNIGIDSLVFADDNPFEREFVRRELPMVPVPELPEDPALYGRCISNSGSFEALRITNDDIARSAQYQGNLQREQLRQSSTDLVSYLKSLDMRLEWRHFDSIGLQRIVQLINKTNQFNLTTRRYSQSDVAAFMNDPKSMTLQLRLTDAFGDNGIIGVVIGRLNDESVRDMQIETWLMSCRVLGRQVEEATLNLVAAEAQRLGAESIVGQYIPTAKNGMVREHYGKLGFKLFENGEDGATRWHLPLGDFVSKETFIQIVEG
ncbi:HAD-IIIC family phosphatase [Hyphomicrobium sp. CS1GBMeth3]|uniref:HAD-IIIC family phosphatase n=1 Tax=Hyphomicrobium sp. CS1GBMeth3 TaxID=1892845 RepID=UPI000930B65F|nr:HAD-IIIC family phosphatase [Hyphomicrobium sp. CS1GBMeth3]